MEDQRAPRRTILVILPVVVLALFGVWAPAGAQSQFQSMVTTLGPNCSGGLNPILRTCGCSVGALNTDELRALAPDEAAAPGTMSTALRTQQLRVLGARLTSLRGGGPGIALSAPTLALDQEPVRIAQTPTATDAGKASSDRSGRLGFFINGTGAFGDRDRTEREEGYDFKNYGATAGADYRVTPNLVGGIALSYYRTDADINLNLGDVQADSYGVALYGTYYVAGFFVDLLGGFAWNKYDTERRIQVPTAGADGVATGETDGQQYTAALGVGYDFRYQAFRVTPLARLDYVNLHVDGFREKNGDGLALQLKSQTAESLQTSVGAQAAYSIGVPFGVLVPQVRGEWRHEFLDDDRSIRARFIDDPNPNAFFAVRTDKPDRDFFVVGGGLSSVFARGLSAFVNYETYLGLRDFTRHEFTGGVRVEF